MNDLNDGAEALQGTSLAKVQTSARNASDVVHEEPAVGGSYIRNPETGTLSKQEPADEQLEQE